MVVGDFLVEVARFHEGHGTRWLQQTRWNAALRVVDSNKCTISSLSTASWRQSIHFSLPKQPDERGQPLHPYAGPIAMCCVPRRCAVDKCASFCLQGYCCTRYTLTTCSYLRLGWLLWCAALPCHVLSFEPGTRMTIVNEPTVSAILHYMLWSARAWWMLCRAAWDCVVMWFACVTTVVDAGQEHTRMYGRELAWRVFGVEPGTHDKREKSESFDLNPYLLQAIGCHHATTTSWNPTG